MSTPRTVPALAVLVLVLAGLMTPSSAARADEPVVPPAGAPVTRPDLVTVSADSLAEVAVLVNDSDPDASDDDLAICRVEPSDDYPLGVSVSTSLEGFGEGPGHPVLDVFAFGADPGTYTLTYYVCDFDYLTAATLTVRVIASDEPYADKLQARPGFVRFHNPGKRRAVIQYGSLQGETVDGRFVLAPRTARTVRIERRSIRWTATVRHRNGQSTYGNILRGITQPARPSRPAGQRHVVRTPDDRTAWRLGTQEFGLRPGSGSTRQVSPVPSGRDESTDAPVTAPDAAVVSQGYFGLADVLDNDADPDGATADLAICRATAPAGSGLEVTPLAGDGFFIYDQWRSRAPRAATGGADDPLPYSLLVQADRNTARGTYAVTYYACDHQYLTPTTLTVTVTRSQRVTAHKLVHRPRLVRFTNPGPHGARVLVLSEDRTRNDGPFLRPIARFRLPAHASVTIRPRARRIFWRATSRSGPGGSGSVRGIGRPTRAAHA